jgi:L-alanine-DL-glutamate epimerase-like enolase superfamily enzyme
MSKVVSLSTEVLSVDSPLRPVESVVVHVTTRDGVTGSSYVWNWSAAAPGLPSGADLIRAGVSYLSPLVAGRDVFAHDALYADVYERTLAVQLAGGPVATAHAAIDMALWDAACKTAGQPLHHTCSAAYGIVRRSTGRSGAALQRLSNS